jgi:ABC-type protease/lipase transport system fused ATPase/permease subunit
MANGGAGSNRAHMQRSANMDSGGASWGIITIVGPLLMLVIFAWALMRNKKSRRSIEETEQATRDLYRKEDAAHRNDDTLGT